MTFEGRAALVTGAATGIGRAVAGRLARDGARLALFDINGPELEAAARALRDAGAQVWTRRVDIAEAAAVERAIGEASAALGGLHILVNNAGIATQKPLLAHTPADFRRIFEVNLFGLFVALREAAKLMREQGLDHGRIINMASVAGLRGSVGRAAYGASKAAVVNLTQVAAVELAPHGITVNAVAPGPIETPLVATMHTPETRTAWLAHLPQRRYGTPEDVAEAVAYLASDAARYVTGHVLVVDGGFTAAGIIFDIAADAGARGAAGSDGGRNDRGEKP